MILHSPKYFISPPKNIISLVPSQTELLSFLGLDKEVTGITKFCVHPLEWFKTKTRVGGTKNVNISLIKKLKPELIIANKEENDKQQIEELAAEFNVWVTDVNDLEDAFKMIGDVGELTHKTKEAKKLIANIQLKFNQLPTATRELRACYLIWQKPYMTVGGDTFINDLMKHCRFKNIFENKKRYPEINISDLHDVGCELILLPSEPFPFTQKHVDELQAQLPGKTIILVDGEMFSWYGSRLLLVPKYFKSLLNF